MSIISNTQKILVNRPNGSQVPDETMFIYETQIINPEELEEGQYVVKIHYISVDPTQKGWMTYDTYMPASPLGAPMRASAVGQVVFSRNEKYPVDTYVTGLFGVQEYYVAKEDLIVIPNDTVEAIGLENYIPVLGLTALPTAYVGMEEAAGDYDKEGKTLLVSGAAGGVGQWVVLLGKLHYNMRVVGIAGTKEKCDYLLEIGCDAAVNYKDEDFHNLLRETCPNGVDVYFDNVGGSITDFVFTIMNNFGRVAFCGYISSYVSSPWACESFGMILLKRLRVQGFLVMDDWNKVNQSYQVGIELVKKGAKFRKNPLPGIQSYIPALDTLWTGHEQKGKVYLDLINF